MSATAADIRYEVWRFIWDQLGYEPKDVLPDKKLSDYDMDEIDIIELVCCFEDEHGVSVDDKRIKPDMTVQELSDYLQSLVQ
jgi:Acyl carrier protein